MDQSPNLHRFSFGVTRAYQCHASQSCSCFFSQAGLASPDDPDQLLIALEPEAASFYCRTLQMKDFLGETGDESVNEGLASYVVVDNGGQMLSVIFLVSLINNQERINKRLNPPYRSYSKGNPSQVIFRSLPISGIQEDIEIANPVS